MRLVRFDASGSAQVRFHGGIFVTDIHEDGDRPGKRGLDLLCPAGFSMPCSRCAAGMPRTEACFATCRSGSKWVIYMGSLEEAAAIINELDLMGYSAEDILSGNGPDVLLQYMEKPMLVRSTRPGTPDFPDIEVELGKAARKSRWRRS